MRFLSAQFRTSPPYARVMPYLTILLITFVQDSFVGPPRYWLYLAKMVIGVWCLWEVWPLAQEVRWAFSWESVVVGVVICLVWIGLDPYYPKLQLRAMAVHVWNPFNQFDEHYFA